MKKTFACAFVLFMFASTTTALAGDKRFCGWVALDGGPLGNINVAAGSWFNKNNLAYGKMCKKAVKKAKKGLKKQGEWEGRDWQKKDGYKCSHVSDDFRDDGKNICVKNMTHDKNGYLIFKIGDDPLDVERMERTVTQ